MVRGCIDDENCLDDYDKERRTDNENEGSKSYPFIHRSYLIQLMILK
ncbi:MAG TPA: hypothetical protein VN704_10160 [Verrucomicrobiae bacterium]|nr:hypothetical protein [Verrucomicrobiae bacterium]